ncbi:alpha-L-rhamnosidase C-terminal domain-containing protein [Streptosporangium sp. NPDC002721]|uniref:alpha-L-rhamnosidase C-terminal domain-containing protein n=1 Tax=Streptosporangium sp. NPDC002721 TaxID=3366188 RepID=UPI003687F3FA
MTNAEWGSYTTPRGLAKSSWTKSDDRFKLKITVPPNTTAEVRVPTTDRQTVIAPHRATFERVEGGHSVYSVPSGDDFVFVVR